MNAHLNAAQAMPWLLDHIYEPFALAERANAKRAEQFGNRIALRSWQESEAAPYALAWEGTTPQQAPASPRVALAVNCDQAQLRQAFLSWLSEQLGPQLPWQEVCAWSLSESSTQRSWLMAALRIMLPASTRVQIRVDKIGLRSAQICLNFGPDSLASPLASSRKLPIAGVVSPHESSKVGLATLVEQAGLVPDFSALGETSSS